MPRVPRYKPTQPGHKVCSHCRIEQPYSAFAFASHTKDRRHSWCRTCRNARNLARYHAAPEPNKLAAREWQRRNRARVREYVRQWRAKNPDKVAQYALNKRRKAMADAEIRT